MKQEKRDKFFKKVKKTEDCWEWLGCKTKLGYGSFGSEKAYRYSYKIHKGEIPDKMCVCHSCDNPSCVNPDHLFLGTHQDNMSDMVSKGRQATGEQLGRKLNNEKVLKIKELIDLKERDEVIAKEYDISPRMIRQIKQGLSWGWLTGYKPRLRKPKEQIKGRLTSLEIIEIDKDIKSGLKILDVMKKYNISKSCASRIRNGETWGWITGNG